MLRLRQSMCDAALPSEQILGQKAREAGDLTEALEHYGAVLAAGGSPGTWQAQRLRTFLDVVQQASIQQVRATIDM
jgi:hypothetical protein